MQINYILIDNSKTYVCICVCVLAYVCVFLNDCYILVMEMTKKVSINVENKENESDSNYMN